VIFGGDGGGETRFDDVHILDVTSLPLRWSELVLAYDVRPDPTWEHVAVQLGDRMVVIGGHSRQATSGAGAASRRTSDVHVLDLNAKEWSVRVRTAGTPPPPLEDAAAALFDNVIYVTGGFDGDSLGTVFALHPAEGDGWRWAEASLSSPFASRYHHTATAFEGIGVVLYGGHHRPESGSFVVLDDVDVLVPLCRRGQHRVEPADGGAVASCVPCQPGRHAPEFNLSACVPCAPGNFTSEPGARRCSPCARGSFAADPGTAGCGLCAPGTYAPFPGADVCLLCPAGTHAGSSGATACDPCPGGTYSDAGASECVECPPGSYGDREGIAHNCTECPAGRQAPFSGSPVCYV